MRTPAFLSVGLVLMCAASTLPSAGQELPKAQPKLINIIRERVKVGRADEHARHEAGWVAAYQKAKNTTPYLALASMTGPSEVWYIVATDSHEGLGKIMEAEEKDPVLMAEVARLTRGDAEFIEWSRPLHAMARPDLSYGNFPDIAEARFFEVTMLQVRPGHHATVEKAARALADAWKRSGVKGSYRVYSVIAGMPTPTYLVFTSVKKFGDFDQAMVDHLTALKASTDEDKALFEKAWGGVLSEEKNRFRVDPKQSYVSEETRKKDPEFWNAK